MFVASVADHLDDRRLTFSREPAALVELHQGTDGGWRRIGGGERASERAEQEESGEDGKLKNRKRHRQGLLVEKELRAIKEEKEDRG
jgi:hypothetical protein